MATSVLLADNHQIVRQGLRAILQAQPDIEVVAEATDGEEAVRATLEHDIDVAILETSMPGLSGIEAVRRIEQSDRGTRCIVLSSFLRYSEVDDAMQAGAAGYVVKTGSADDLIRAIAAARSGRSYLCQEATQLFLSAITGNRSEPPSGVTALTNREREVLQFISEGDSSKEIAARLGVCQKTVESHRASLMNKLGIHKAASLVRFAIREGLVAP